jgi:hypothetical protein
MNASSVFCESEQHLVARLCRVLESQDSPFGEAETTREFDYRRGRTDVVAITRGDHIWAFEAKMEKWRDALQQAYRNTCFAHFSYVLVPKDVARRAAQHAYEFERRAVGLCYLERRDIVVVLPARFQEPIQHWLSEAAIAAVKGEA